jgi:lipoate-protein ligase A
MQNLQTVRVKVTHLKKEDGELTINDEEAAEELCRSFKEVFTAEDVDNILDDDHQENNEQLSDKLQDVEFTTELVYKSYFI